MNKVKEFLKRTRLSSWHIYSIVILYMLLTFVYTGYADGYTGYLERRQELTLSEFESLLAWLTISSVLIVTDVVISLYFWYKENKDESIN